MIKLYKEGQQHAHIAELLEFPKTTNGSIIQKFWSTGSAENIPRKSERKSLIDLDKTLIFHELKKDRNQPTNSIESVECCCAKGQPEKNVSCVVKKGGDGLLIITGIKLGDNCIVF